MTDRTEAMDNLIAQDADLIDMDTKRVAEITQADRDAAAQYDVVEAFARHRQYGYDQGYYDGRQADGAKERAKIVAWLRGMGLRNINYIADAIEVGEHLK